MPGSTRAALPPVEIPPELVPVTDNLFRTLYNEVTANPPPVRKLQVIEGVQAGADGAPTTAISGEVVANIPGIKTTPLAAPPEGTPPPGNCGLPNALAKAVDPATGVLPEGPISAVSGGFRLRNTGQGGPKEVRLVTNCEECANVIGQNPGRLTPTGFPPDAVLVVTRDGFKSGNVDVPVGGRLIINSKGLPTYNGQPIELPTNTEFGFEPPARWAGPDGVTLSVPAPVPTLTRMTPPPIDAAGAAAGGSILGAGGARQ